MRDKLMVLGCATILIAALVISTDALAGNSFYRVLLSKKNVSLEDGARAIYALKGGDADAPFDRIVGALGTDNTFTEEWAADAARNLGLTRARVSQLMDLLMLAPDIQEKILFMERVDGIEPTSERALRRVVSEENWAAQRCILPK